MRQIVTMLMMAVAVLSSTTMLGEEIYEIYPVPQVQLVPQVQPEQAPPVREPV